MIGFAWIMDYIPPAYPGEDIHKLKIHFDKLLRQVINRASVSDI
jgi:hypothetical protein